MKNNKKDWFLLRLEIKSWNIILVPLLPVEHLVLWGKLSWGLGGTAEAKVCPFFFFNSFISKCQWWVIAVFFYGIPQLFFLKKIIENLEVMTVHFHSAGVSWNTKSWCGEQVLQLTSWKGSLLRRDVMLLRMWGTLELLSPWWLTRQHFLLGTPAFGRTTVKSLNQPVGLVSQSKWVSQFFLTLWSQLLVSLLQN